MTVGLWASLNERMRRERPDVVLRRMGYRNPDSRTCRRLRRVLSDTGLGQDAPEYDFVFASRAFVEALCAALGIDATEASEGLDAIDEARAGRSWSGMPWVFVETGFKREDHPGLSLTVLAFAESSRRLQLPADTAELTPSHQLKRAQYRVRKHMAETGGVLGVWGHIQRYMFHDTDGRAIAVSRDGAVIGECENDGRGRARLAVNGRAASWIPRTPFGR